MPTASRRPTAKAVITEDLITGSLPGINRQTEKSDRPQASTPPRDRALPPVAEPPKTPEVKLSGKFAQVERLISSAMKTEPDISMRGRHVDWENRLLGNLHRELEGRYPSGREFRLYRSSVIGRVQRKLAELYGDQLGALERPPFLRTGK